MSDDTKKPVRYYRRDLDIALVWSVLACVSVAWAALPGMARWWGPRR